LLWAPVFVAMPADHPLARKRGLRLADLADDPWIGSVTDCECNRLVNRACAVAGFEPRIEFETDDYTAMQGFVAAGVGVCLIAELGLTSVREDIVIRSLGRETPIREVYAATALDSHRTPATQAMLEILQGVAARYESRRPQLQLVG
jgi:DNA-binding transcriptional LysR family regulator